MVWLTMLYMLQTTYYLQAINIQMSSTNNCGEGRILNLNILCFLLSHTVSKPTTHTRTLHRLYWSSYNKWSCFIYIQLEAHVMVVLITSMIWVYILLNTLKPTPNIFLHQHYCNVNNLLVLTTNNQSLRQIPSFRCTNIWVEVKGGSHRLLWIDHARIEISNHYSYVDWSCPQTPPYMKCTRSWHNSQIWQRKKPKRSYQCNHTWTLYMDKWITSRPYTLCYTCYRLTSPMVVNYVPQ